MSEWEYDYDPTRPSPTLFACERTYGYDPTRPHPTAFASHSGERAYDYDPTRNHPTAFASHPGERAYGYDPTRPPPTPIISHPGEWEYGYDPMRHSQRAYVISGSVLGQLNNRRKYACPVGGCVAGVRTWTASAKLDAHLKNWHGPHVCHIPDCTRGGSNGFGTSSDLALHLNKDHAILPPNTSARSSTLVQLYHGAMQTLDIHNRDQGNTSDSDKRFKKHKSTDFEFGKIFKVVWSEPVGNGGAEITLTNQWGTETYQKIRRFLIIDNKKGHCLCLPILTYGGQATLKYGVRPEDHAIIYSGKSPVHLSGEKGLIIRRPIRCDMSSPSDKLDPASRLNYAKVYTVEHNVSIYFIGKVRPSSEQQIVIDYNKAHQPLPSRPPPTPAKTEQDLEQDLIEFQSEGGIHESKAHEQFGSSVYLYPKPAQATPNGGNNNISGDFSKLSIPEAFM